MVQILEEVPTFGSQLGRSFGKALMGGIGGGIEGHLEKKRGKELAHLSEAREQQENETINRLIGKDISGIRDPKMRQEILSEALKGETSQRKMGMEMQEKRAPLHGALETINEMKKIKETGHLGPKISQGLFTGLASADVRKDRAKYEQLGKSLISLASSIPIRNQKEFEALAHGLYDPTRTEAEIEGILEAMEDIVKRSMGDYGQSSSESDAPSGNKQQEKPPLMSFFR